MLDIQTNLTRVFEQIEKAAQRTGRKPEEIVLVAVTKNVEAQKILEALESGVKIIGENRIREAESKLSLIGKKAVWHLVGHLQTNKVKKALEIFETIQSVDSLHLASELNQRAKQKNKKIDVLIEVNTSGETTKFGFLPSGVIPALKEMAIFEALNIRGLMTVGLFSSNQEEVRPCFRLLRKLKEEIERLRLDKISIDYLSMGMSGDFEMAIEEGSNMVRIGAAIFGPRQ
ncbi:MAG: YggS family pyridoxal phosphate-dependent enzyme [Candidatus Edwardsbacteria bacterium]